ncbi:serine recombinase [Clostridia bacterium]|nr:serine recombinase [Clostridia bacterium]
MVPSADVWTQNIVVSPYCRVSTDKEDQRNSLESQIQYFTAFIKSHPNWTLGEVYYDEGITGTAIKKRKNFNRLIHDALAGNVQFIITKEVSRFARNTLHTLDFTRKLKARGVGVYFILDNINTLDSDGELRLTIMASLAQEESRKTSERIKWGQKRMMERGFAFGGPMYGLVITDGKITVDPEEAPLVKFIFDRYADGGSCYGIAREINEKGIKTKRGRVWTHNAIFKILRNEKYVGDLRQQKTFTPDFLTHESQKNKIENTLYLKNTHEAIIDRGTWNQVQAELQRRVTDSAEKRSRYTNRYWCSGKVFCAECGRKFIRRQSVGKNRRYNSITWRCYAAVSYGKEKLNLLGEDLGCKNYSVNDKALSLCMREVLKFIQINKSLLMKEISSEIKTVQAQSEATDVVPLQNKIDELNGYKTRSIDLFVKEMISQEELKRQKLFYDGEIERISKQISDIQANNRLIREQTIDLQKMIDEAANISNLKYDIPLLYGELLDRIEVHKSKALVFYLQAVPFGIKVIYSIQGCRDAYTVNIKSRETIR